MDPRDDLIRHYRWLRQYGYNDSHSGNLSVRDGERFWVTPTGACADTIAAGDLVACPVDGAIAEGASSDAPLHQATYRLNPALGAVMHSHGAHTIALTMNGEDYRPVDFEGQYYFDVIPVIRIDYARYFAEAPTRVPPVLAEHPVVVVRGHGVYAAAASLNLAYKWTCSLELSARTDWLARVAGTL